MAAINHGGTFYRLDESSQSGDCGEANVMALHLASKQVITFAFAVKGIPFGKASLKLKRKATASEQDHSRRSFLMYFKIYLFVSETVKTKTRFASFSVVRHL